MPTECIADLFGFASVEGRRVEASFDGGKMTSDAGGLLLGATDRVIGLIDRFAQCFASIVEESLRAGAMVTAVARRHDMHPNLLHHWRRQARRGLEGGQEPKFLPVVVAPPTRSGSQASGTIEFELGGARVRVDASVDEAALGRVLRALGR